MGKRRLILLSMSCVVVAVFIAVSLTESAQVNPQQVVPPAQSRSSGQWPIAGQSLNNNWNQPAEHKIGPANVQDLSPRWVFN